MAHDLKCKHCGTAIRLDGANARGIAHCTVCGTANEVRPSAQASTVPAALPPAESRGSELPRIRMWLFMLLFAGGLLIGLGMGSAAGYDEYGDPHIVSQLAILPVLCALISYVVFWHRAWRAIQDGHARTTPGRAVGLLFVPFYHIYWYFQVTWGFAKDFNAYIGRYNLDVKRLPEGLYLASPVLLLVGIVPFLTPAVLANLVIMGILIARTSRGVNALPSTVGLV